MSSQNATELWPEADDEEDFDRIARDERALGPGVRALCAALGASGEPVRYPGGSHEGPRFGPPAHTEDFLARTLAWFTRHLGDPA